MTATQLKKDAKRTHGKPVEGTETAIDELMLSVVHNLKKLPLLARQTKAAECMARIDRTTRHG